MAPPFVTRYLTALNRHKWAGIAGFGVVFGLSFIPALQPAPPTTYVSEGVLTYVVPPISVSQTAVELQQQAQELTAKALLSDAVIQSVMEQLTAKQLAITVDELKTGLSVVVNPEDENGDEPPGLVVVVSYQDLDPQRVQLVTQTTMEAILEQSRVYSTQQLSRILDNLKELVPKIEGELRAAEQNLERYIRTEGPAIFAAEDGQVLGAITGGQQQRRQLLFQLQGIDAQISSLESRLGLSADEAYVSAALSADPIIADLRAKIYDAESQMSLLSQTLRPQHPTIVDLRTQQRAYEELLQQRVSEVLGGGGQNLVPFRATSRIREASSLDPARQQLADTLVGLQTQRDTLRQQLQQLTVSEQELRQEYQTIPNKQIQQARLQQQVALKQAFYDQLQARLADVTIAEKESAGNMVIAQEATAPETAEVEAQNPILILAIGGLVGILVGGGLVLLLDSLDATFHTLPDLQGALRQQEVPVLGLLPILPPPREPDEIPVLLEADSPYLELYERFRSTLRRLNTTKPLRMVLLTSTVNGEGKTDASYNLAIASARAGKRTLLIEADLRSPSQAKSLNVSVDPDHALEPLRYYGQLSECIRLVPEVENLYILPNPGVQRNAAAVLESSEMRRMLEDVRGRFDLVILDTPSLSRYSDALLLEPLTDGLLLVTRPGYTEDGLLSEAVEQFTESDDIQFLGAVINAADIPVQPQDIVEAEQRYVIEDLETQSEPSEKITVGTSRDG